MCEVNKGSGLKGSGLANPVTEHLDHDRDNTFEFGLIGLDDRGIVVLMRAQRVDN
jgi:hypothetical protein